MFLPYEYHYENGNNLFNTVSNGDRINLFGVQSIEVYAILFLIIIIAAITLIKRSFTTSIIGALLGVILLVGIPFLGLALTFNLFGYYHRIGIGMGIGFSMIVLYFILLIINMVIEFRKRKSIAALEIADDLIDTDI